MIIAHTWGISADEISHFDGLPASFRASEVGAPGQHYLLIPKDIGAKTRELYEKDRGKEGRRGAVCQTSNRTGRRYVLLAPRMVYIRTHPTPATIGPNPRADVLGWLFISASWLSVTMGGYNWTASQPIVGYGSDTTFSVVRKKDSTLVAYLRDNGPPPKRAHVSYSKDDGVSWTIAVDTDILNPRHEPRSCRPSQR